MGSDACFSVVALGVKFYRGVDLSCNLEIFLKALDIKKLEIFDQKSRIIPVLVIKTLDPDPQHRNLPVMQKESDAFSVEKIWKRTPDCPGNGLFVDVRRLSIPY
jgi:hypothetical protein